MLISGGKGKPIRNLVRRWHELSPGSRIPLFSCRGRRGMDSSENSKELLLEEEESWDPARVPKGYLAVYVGAERRRFVIPARYLGVPAMRMLMERAAEEFGYEQKGGLRIPCEEEAFQEILQVLQKQTMKKNRILL